MSDGASGIRANADVDDNTFKRTVSHAVPLLPGLAVGAAVTAVALVINGALPTVSPLLIAILLGAVFANVMRIPEWMVPGLQFSAKKLLRIGIALLGLQLVLGDILTLGPGVAVMVVAVVLLGSVGTVFVGKVMGVPRTQRILIACGFSICGAAAVAAADGVIEAKKEEVLTATALVVLFGTLMIPIIPLLAHGIGMADRDAGLWAGGSIHEVAQVVAAGEAIGAGALAVAVVVKLARVLLLAPVIAVLSVLERRRVAEGDSRRPPLVPLFVMAFLAFVVIRSTGAIPSSFLNSAQVVQTMLLTIAMFALGAGVRLSTIREVGVRPVGLALASTVWVAAIALTAVLIVA